MAALTKQGGADSFLLRGDAGLCVIETDDDSVDDDDDRLFREIGLTESR